MSECKRCKELEAEIDALYTRISALGGAIPVNLPDFGEGGPTPNPSADVVTITKRPPEDEMSKL